jgi:hypothetical protein
MAEDNKAVDSYYSENDDYDSDLDLSFLNEDEENSKK